jgi:hypothetical protein
MKKIMTLVMLIASVAVITCCSAQDPFEEFSDGNSWGNSGGNMSGGNGSSATTGELATFDITIEQTTAEPTDVAAEYFPDEEDVLENNEFTKEVSIDLSNPVSKTENGVEITVNGGHVTANHASEKKICYVVSGTTMNGSFTVIGDKKYAVKLNGVNITNPDSAALSLLSGKRAFVILADSTTNTLTDGTGGSQKGALYCKGKLLFNGSGSLSVTGNANNGIHSADYIAFSKYVCQVLHEITPNSRIAYLSGDLSPQQVKEMGISGIDYNQKVFDQHPNWAKQAKALGLEVNVWTVDGEEDLTKFAKMPGIDLITTNDPDKLKEILKKK